MRVEKLLKQLKREFIKVNVLQALLDALLFFLIANLITFIFKISIVQGARTTTYSIGGYATASLQMGILAGISVIVAAIDLYYRSQQYRLELYEEKNPELQEILRTARDNIDTQNIVSQALFDELLEKARKVTSESIIPAKEIIYKTLAVGFLSFLTVMSGLAGTQIGGQGIDVFTTPDQVKDILNQQKNESGFQLKNASDIYGDESDIDASDIDIDFNVTGSGTAEEGDFNPNNPPPEEELVLDSSGGTETEDIEIAKRYSLAIRNLG